MIQYLLSYPRAGGGFKGAIQDTTLGGSMHRIHPPQHRRPRPSSTSTCTQYSTIPNNKVAKTQYEYLYSVQYYPKQQGGQDPVQRVPVLSTVLSQTTRWLRHSTTSTCTQYSTIPNNKVAKTKYNEYLYSVQNYPRQQGGQDPVQEVPVLSTVLSLLALNDKLVHRLLFKQCWNPHTN